MRRATPRKGSRMGMQTMGRPRAFTIVEMLIVVAVIGLLLSIGLSALASAQDRGRKTRELNRLRQVLIGWTMYSGQAGEQVLPGFLDNATQTAWRVKYRNRAGTDLDPALAQTYPWRLLPFLDFNIEPMLGYRAAAEGLADDSLYESGTPSPDPPPEVYDAAGLNGAGAALQPGIAYNAYYLGGWWTNAVPLFEDSQWQDGSVVQRGKLVARSTSHIRRPSELHAFLSATLRAPGELRPPFDHLPGWAWVVPPNLAGVGIWEIHDDHIDIETTQGVPLTRYGNTVAAGMCDGSTRNTSIDNLEDMRGWIGNAGSKTFQHGPG